MGYPLTKYCVNYALYVNFAEFSIAHKDTTEGFSKERPRPKEEEEKEETASAVEKVHVK